MESFIGIIGAKENKENFDEYESKYSDTNLTVLNKQINNNYYCSVYESEHYLLQINGIILNESELCRQYNDNQIDNVIVSMFSAEDSFALKELEGEFSIIFFEKDNGQLRLITNHTNSYPLFYFKANDLFIFSNNFLELSKYLKNNNLFSIDNNGMYMMLSFGFMLHDTTYAKHTYKILPNTMLSLFASDLVLKSVTYDNLFSYSKKNDENTYDTLTTKFNSAIEKEYRYDIKSHSNHLVTLSGGLDSRLNLFAAIRKSFTSFNVLSFSQSDYLDEILVKRICKDKGIPYLINYLDGGDYLMDIDNVVKINGGLVTYNGAAHLYSTLNKLSLSSFGLLHTGQLGDAIFGTYLNSSHGIGYSSKYISKIDIELIDSIEKEYKTQEEYKFYNRGLNGIMNGFIIASYFLPAVSPFLDKDFMRYVLAIDDSKRKNEKIYIRWINEKFKEMLDYKWERINAKPTVTNHFFHDQLLFIKNVKRYIYKKFGVPWYMNDFGFWYKKNRKMRLFFDNYYKENVKRVEALDIYSDIDSLWNTGTIREKFQVLTFLSFIKQLNNV